MSTQNPLIAHLKTGTTTTCRCWLVTRQDGQKLGFTDHDQELKFDGDCFKAHSGMTARALHQSTGLSVDNSEALGALNHASVSEDDIMAGRYDGAEVCAWLVNWANPEERMVQFRGTIGEITQAGGTFTAELRGLAEALNQPQGRIYHADCSALLGDAECGVDLVQAGYTIELAISEVEDARILRFNDFNSFEDRWFQNGVVEVLTGPAKGLIGQIQQDRTERDQRIVILWDTIRASLSVGDRVRLTAGCDRRAETCRLKFNNFLNFRGFPHIPGEDWLMAYPKQGQGNDGGSLT